MSKFLIYMAANVNPATARAAAAKAGTIDRVIAATLLGVGVAVIVTTDKPVGPPRRPPVLVPAGAVTGLSTPVACGTLSFPVPISSMLSVVELKFVFAREISLLSRS